MPKLKYQKEETPELKQTTTLKLKYPISMLLALKK
jgi:hypothetical protein